MTQRVPSGSTTNYVYFNGTAVGLTNWYVARTRNGSAAAVYSSPTVVEVGGAAPGVYALLVDEDTTISLARHSEQMTLFIASGGGAVLQAILTIEIYNPTVQLQASQPNRVTFEKGVLMQGDTGVAGLHLIGADFFPGLQCDGGPGGRGANIIGKDASDFGMLIQAGSSGNGDGLRIRGYGSGHALELDAAGTGLSVFAPDGVDTGNRDEVAAVPAADASLEDKINYVFAYITNTLRQTATEQTLRNRADDADIASQTVSDDGTTFVKGSAS